jgi:hypothetical protein
VKERARKEVKVAEWIVVGHLEGRRVVVVVVFGGGGGMMIFGCERVLCVHWFGGERPKEIDTWM